MTPSAPRLLAQILLLSLACSLPLLGQGASLHIDPEEAKRQLTGTREDLVDENNQTTIIKNLRAFRDATSADEQRMIVSDLAEFCVMRGLRPAPDLAELFLLLAEESRAAGKTDEFRRLAGFAGDFDPSHPAVHLALASVAMKQKGLVSGEFLFEALNAAILSFQHPHSRPVALANLALWLRITAFLLLGVLSLLLLMRYHPLIRHDVHEWLGGQDATWNRTAGWVAVFLPSLLFLGGYWWIVYWASIFLLYARWSERAVTLLAGLMVVASGSFLSYRSQEVFLAQSQPHVSNLRSYENRIDVGADAYLTAHVNPQDPLQNTYAFLLANRYMVHGSYQKAEALYKSLLTQEPGNALVMNNLGCILYYEGRFQEAIQMFSKAIEADSRMPSPHFNRSLAQNKIFNFTEAKEDQDKVGELDRGFIERNNLTNEEEWRPVPSFQNPDKTRQLALELERRREGVTGFGRKPSLSWISLLTRPSFSLVLLVLLGGFLAAAVVKKRDFFSHACFKCGRPFCSRCKTSLEFESFCGQCVHLYIKQDGVSPEARLRKNYEVEAHNRLMRVLRAALSLAAPGAGHFVEGRPFSCLFLLLLWCGLVSAFLMRFFALPLPFNQPADPFASAYALAGTAMMLALWLAFGLTKALSRDIPQFGHIVRS